MKTLQVLFCLPLALCTGALADSSADIQAATDSVFTPWEQGYVTGRGYVFPDFWTLQNAVSLDGADAAMWIPGGDTMYLEQSWLKTTVTGPTVLHFSYGLKPKEASAPHLGTCFIQMKVDGEPAGNFPGSRTWEEGSITVGPGSHVVS